MRGKFSLIAFVAFIVLLSMSGFTATGEELQLEEDKTKVNIIFYQEIDRDLLEKYDADIIHEYESIHAVTVEMSSIPLSALSEEINIKSVQYDQPVQLQAQMRNWGYDSLKVNQRIPSYLSGKGINIAIIDSGIDLSHPDLRVAGGGCFITAASESDACANGFDDDNGHGTHVAGIIAALDNDIGVVGIAPEANVYALKALDKEGGGMTSSIVAAIDWAIQNKMDIINLSLATKDNDLLLKEMIKKAYDSNIMIIAAAGNEKHETGLEENIGYPAKYEEVIAVTALKKDLTISTTSAVGSAVDFAAPGISIKSTVPSALSVFKGLSYADMSGTSMAAPFVAGVAALYMEKFPDLTNEEIRNLMMANAIDLGEAGRDSRYGYGLIQLDASLINRDIASVTASANETATVRIDIKQLPQGATHYNLYRYDQKIISNGTASSIVDYGAQGKVEYRLVPLIDGLEVAKAAAEFTVQLTEPAIKDVNNQAWFSRNMLYLYKEGIMKGYLTGELKPFQLITREEAVMLLVNALDLPLQKTTLFDDVHPNSVAAGHIGAASAAGIIGGYPDGSFRPQQAVTRAEMSILIANAYQLSAGSGNLVNFKDLSTGMAAYNHINRVVANEIAQGYLDQTFRPDAYMSRSTFAVFLSRAENELLK